MKCFGGKRPFESTAPKSKCRRGGFCASYGGWVLHLENGSDFGFKVWSSPVRDSEALVHLAHVENLAVETLRYLPRPGQVVDG